MKKPVYLVLVFLAFFAIFAISLIPANVAMRMMAIPDNIKVNAVSGSIWSGRAQQAQINGEWIDSLKWDVQAAALLTGNLKAKISFGQPRDKHTLSGKGEVQFGLLTSDIQVSDFIFRAPLEKIVKYAPAPIPFKTNGRAILDVNYFQIGQPYCTDLDAGLQLTQTQIQGLSGWFQLGAIESQLSCKSGNLAFVIDTPNRMGLEVDGQLLPSGQPEINGFVKPDPELPKEVHQAVRFLGQPDAQGRYVVKI